MKPRKDYRIPKPITILLYGFLPLTSFVLLAIGLYGDRQQWWQGQPYLTNILTTATGATLGIPIAVGILQRIIAMQAGREDWLRTVRLLKRNVNGIAVSLRSSVDADDPEQAIKQVDVALLDLLSRFTKFMSEATELKRESGRSDGPLTQEYADELESRSEGIFDTIDQARALSSNYLLKDPMVALSLNSQLDENWNSLESVVKPAFMEAGQEWLQDDIYNLFRHTNFAFGTFQEVDDMLRKVDGVIKEALARYRAELYSFTASRNPLTMVVFRIHNLRQLMEQLPKLEEWRDNVAR